MVDNGLLPDGPTEIMQAVAPLQGLPTKFKVGKVSWTTSLNRLEFTTDDETIDLGSIAQAAIDKLPHTPIAAVGNNYHVEAEDGIFAVSIDGGLARMLPEGTALSFVVRVPLGDGGVARVEIDEDTPKLAKINFHRQVSGAGEAKAAAGKWRADGERIASLLLPLQQATE